MTLRMLETYVLKLLLISNGGILLLGHLSLKKSVVRIQDILINFKAECPLKMTTGKMI